MSDTDTSGAPTSASAETAGQTPPASSPGATQPFGTFGSTRGSGLARGKRAAVTTAPAAGTGGYQPSALEVIRPQSEYKNPFTGETSVGAPPVNEPAPQAAPLPAPVAFVPSAPVAKPAPAAAPAPAPAPAPTANTGELFPFSPSGSTQRTPAASSAPVEKPELKILPPAETKRPATSWESSGPSAEDDRRAERPTFRPERRESKPFEPREGKPFDAREQPKPFAPREPKPFAPREPRRDQRQGDARPNASYGSGHQQPYAPRAPRPNVEEPKPAGGFFAWLKGLFSGKPAEPTPAPRTDGDQRRDRDGGFQGDGQRRRHRGGRGRGGFQGDNRGPRDGQPFQHRDPRDEAGPSSSEGGERNYGGGGGQGGEYREGGGGRRRRRGGRGRNRGEGGGNGGGGDRRNDPNPEGQQGGGAI